MTKRMLRRWIGKRLADYYAQPAQAVVGSTGPRSISLSSLWGEWHWQKVSQELYEQQEGQWLTPVELFKPHYSNAIANFIDQAVGRPLEEDSVDDSNCKSLPVDIIELGGGRGTNARLILDHLQLRNPSLYDRVSYTIVDSSPSLHQLQDDMMKTTTTHYEKVKLQKSDLLDIAEGNESLLPPAANNNNNTTTNPVVVIALELLDNLPHDKIRIQSRGRIEQAEVMETTIVTNNDDTANTNANKVFLEERFVELSDPLLKDVLSVTDVYTRVPATSTSTATATAMWVPTVACGLIQHLYQIRPDAHLLLADFDWLPAPNLLLPPPPPVTTREDERTSTSTTNSSSDSSSRQQQRRRRQSRRSVLASGEPIVTSMDGLDHECYLNAPDHCDILFPTDFTKLKAFTEATLNTNTKTNTNTNTSMVRVDKQADFLQRVAPDEVHATKSWLTGYTPLLYDFENCSVLTVTQKQSKKVKSKNNKNSNEQYQ